MNIKRLAIKGFLSYRQADLDFRQIEVACITGHNGSGKSSLLDAITWALFGQARRKDDSIINAQSEAASVTIEFEYEGNQYQVMRSKKKDRPVSLELRIWSDGKWKAITEATVRETEARIQSILRMDFETFVNASFFLQGKADQFTQQRPGDRKRILINILGLDAWENYRELAAARRRKLEADLTEMNGRIQEILAELEEEPIRIRRLGDIEERAASLTALRQEKEKQIESLRQLWALIQQRSEHIRNASLDLNRMRARRDGIAQTIDGRRQEQEQFAGVISQADEIQALHARWLAARQAITEMDASSGSYHLLQARRVEVSTRMQAEEGRLRQEFSSLSARRDEMASVAAELDVLRGTRAEKESVLAKVKGSLEQLAAVEAEIEAQRTANAEARAENPRLKEEMTALKERISHLQSLSGEETACPFCDQPLSAHHKEQLVADLTAQGRALGDRFRANGKLMADSEEALRSLGARLRALQEEDASARALSQEIAVLSSRIEAAEQMLTGWETGAARLAEVEVMLESRDYARAEQTVLADIHAQLAANGYDLAAHEAIRQEEQSTRQAEELMRALESARATIASVAREVASHESQLLDLDAELDAKTSEYDQIVLELAHMQEQAPDLEVEEQALASAHEKEGQAILDLGGAKQKVEVLESLKARVKAMNEAKAETSQNIAQIQQLEKAFGRDGVPALLIEQALPAIEAKANEILDGLSGGTISVKFLTQREFKDRKREDLRETLDILISDPFGEREYESLSGGEAFRVNFAIRLALSEILAQRAGARLQMLVIDEGFGSQDEDGRQRLVEAINGVLGKFEKVLVVTHIDALKDAFPTRIEVSKGEEGSFVSVV